MQSFGGSTHGTTVAGGMALQSTNALPHGLCVNSQYAAFVKLDQARIEIVPTLPAGKPTGKPGTLLYARDRQGLFCLVFDAYRNELHWLQCCGVR